MILSEHLVHCDTDGMDFKTPWYMWTVGRLQQVFMMVSNEIRNILDNDLHLSLNPNFFRGEWDPFGLFLEISNFCCIDIFFKFQHHEQVEKYSTTLETLLFTQDLDPNILDVFQQFVALRM